MKISIITVCYNSSRHIRTAIESVLHQTYQDIEYIIVDGKSEDATLSIIKEYESAFGGRMRWISERDNGLYDAMNKGIGVATGEILGILNSDDMYQDVDVIADVVSCFESSGYDAVYGDLVYVDSADVSRVRRRWKSGSFRRSSFLFGWMPPHPTFFVRKSVYCECGFFRTDFRNSADYEFILRAVYKHRISLFYLPRTLVRMRLGGESNSTFGNRLNAYREDRLAWVVNDVKPLPVTHLLKPVRKVGQFFARYGIQFAKINR
jgi:glycosyltransferase involved in cell wall biosynthesis